MNCGRQIHDLATTIKYQMRAPTSPLGITVEAYARGGAFLRVALPCLIATFVGAALLAAQCSAARRPVAAAAAYGLAALSALLSAVATYGVCRISSWLPSVLAPCYELRVVPESGGPAALFAVPAAVSAGGPSARAAWEARVTARDRDRDRVVLRAVYSDRLGNHAFQYAYARVRAAFLDVPFEAPRLGGPWAAVAVRVERWAPRGGAGGSSGGGYGSSSGSCSINDGSEPHRHALLLRARECCSGGGRRDARDDASVAGSRGRRAAAVPLAAPPCAAACGGLGPLLRSPRWLAVAHSWLHTPSCRYAMNTRLFAGHERAIADWLAPGLAAAGAAGATGSEDAVLSWGPRDVAIHVRVGDILWGHHPAYRPLPMSFYRAALRAVALSLPPEESRGAAGGASAQRLRRRGSAAGQGEGSVGSAVSVASAGRAAPPHPPPSLGRVVIVSEDPRHALVRDMAAHLRTQKDVAVASVSVAGGGSVSSDLAALASAPALVLSVSSFAWWPAFLSATARRVVVPQWGLLLPHTWRPSPAAHPSVECVQDMTLRAVPPAERRAPQVALATLQDALEGVLGREGAPLPRFDPAPRVTVVPLPDLAPWPGNTHDAVKTLFD